MLTHYSGKLAVGYCCPLVGKQGGGVRIVDCFIFETGNIHRGRKVTNTDYSNNVSFQQSDVVLESK